jgi:hypothetical protein
MSELSASKYVKQRGLKNLTVVSNMTGKPCGTLRNWHRDENELFKIVITGCIETKKKTNLKGQDMKFKVILVAEDGEYTLTGAMSYDAAAAYCKRHENSYGEGQALCIEVVHV